MTEADVRITYQMEGGFTSLPGLAAPMTIDSASLPPEQAGELERRVQAARFFALPALAGAPARGAADHRTYTVTIEDGGRTHTVRASDPVEDAGLRDLLAYVRTLRP